MSARDTGIQYEALPYNGPQAAQLDYANGVTAPVFQGPWLKTAGLKSLSLEFAGSISTLSATLRGTNSLEPPANAYTVTVGGSATAADVLTLTFKGNLLITAGIAVSYTVVGGDTLTIMAAGLAAAINANATLKDLGIIATSAIAVVTINWPSVRPATAGETTSSQTPRALNSISVTSSLSAGPSETLTVAVASGGTTVLTTTQLGFLNPAEIPRYTSLTIDTLTGGGAVVSCLASGTA